MDSEFRPPNATTLATFAVAVVLGGGNFLAVRFSNRELEPLWGAALRFGVAAVLFTGIVVVMRLRWPRGKVLALNIAFGLLSFAIFYALVYWALVRVTAGVASVVLAAVPLATLLLATAHGMERISWRPVVGSLFAIAGITWMTIGPQEIVLPLTALGALVLAVVCVGESVIVGKKLSANHPAMTNAVAMIAGATALLAMSAVAGDPWVLPTEPEVVWSVLYLVTAGSVALFLLILLVVRQWTASATSYMFVLFPLVTMLLGAWLADEAVTLQGVTGAVLVMVGVWFGALSPGTRRNPRSGRPLAQPTG